MILWDSTSLNAEVPNYADSLGRDLSGLRIGVPKEYFVEGMEPDVGAQDARGDSHAGKSGR